MDRMIGKSIHQYRVLEVLGRGGMGVVYRAHDSLLDRDVALKTMDVLMASDPNFIRRFQSEARALARLNDPNIVSIFNLLETPEGICIAMEYVRGRTLSDVLKATPLLPVQRVLRIFRQVFTALDHAHREGVIHRDIKPGNVMLTNADIVKITDFGLAKIQTATGTTVTKGTAGTLFYMSPEQIRGLGQVDNRGDIYSAGMALYESLAGALPFPPDASEYTIANMIVEGTINPPGSINKSLPRDLSNLVMKAIDRDPRKRYQSAAEVLSALQRLSGGSGGFDITLPAESSAATTQYLPSPELPHASGHHRWKLYAALVGGLLALGFAYFALRLSVFPPAGRLSVMTDPPGAGVIIDKAAIRVSPVQDVTLSPGRHTVIASWDDGSVDTSVTIRSGQPALIVITKPLHSGDLSGAVQEIAASPAAAGGPEASGPESHLTLVAVPAGEAAVDGGTFQPAGTPLTLGVHAGTRKVTFRDGKGTVKERSVNMRAGEANTVRCYFQGIVNVEATLDFILSPAAIVVDGVPRRAMTPGKISLPAGKHRIAVRLENYVCVPEEQTVTVEPSFDAPKPYSVTFKLKREQ
ncbi:MAG TPA: serine/threonine-protein kinase [Bacteroidota bacterium]|nr:serine/threonine-protein kinase [Bacteroidota bacterium]